MNTKKTAEHLRFFQKVKKVKSCWLWIGSLSTSGYPHLWIDGKKAYGHRWSYKFHNGDIPKDMAVCHKCNTPSCVNPEHLYLATRSVNVKHAWRDGLCKPNPRNKSCRRGHAMKKGSYKEYKIGRYYQRYCVECMRINRRKRWLKSHK